MADPSAPSPKWEAIKALVPSIGQCLVMLVGLFVAVGTTYWAAKPEPQKIVMHAADAPRPVPMVAIGDLENLLAPYGAKLDELAKRIDERYPKAPEPKIAPSKVRPIK